MRSIIVITLFVLFSFFASAQNKYYVRSDFGIAKANINSNITELSNEKIDVILGFYLGYSLFKNIDIELGVNYYMFSNSFTLKLDDNSKITETTMSSESAYVILPLNAFYNIRLPNTKFIIKPHIGFSYCSHTTQNQQYEAITFENFDESNNLTVINSVDSLTSYNAKPDYNKTLLFNTGLSVEYCLTKRFSINVNTNYSQGINEINKQGVLLKREDNNLSGILSHNGSHLYASCGFKLNF